MIFLFSAVLPVSIARAMKLSVPQRFTCNHTLWDSCPKCRVEQQLPAIDVETFTLCRSLILPAQAIWSHLCLNLWRCIYSSEGGWERPRVGKLWWQQERALGFRSQGKKEGNTKWACAGARLRWKYGMQDAQLEICWGCLEKERVEPWLILHFHHTGTDWAPTATGCIQGSFCLLRWVFTKRGRDLENASLRMITSPLTFQIRKTWHYFNQRYEVSLCITCWIWIPFNLHLHFDQFQVQSNCKSHGHPDFQCSAMDLS